MQGGDVTLVVAAKVEAAAGEDSNPSLAVKTPRHGVRESRSVLDVAIPDWPSRRLQKVEVHQILQLRSVRQGRSVVCENLKERIHAPHPQPWLSASVGGGKDGKPTWPRNRKCFTHRRRFHSDIKLRSAAPHPKEIRTPKGGAKKNHPTIEFQ
jgi:hypothetical protein